MSEKTESNRRSDGRFFKIDEFSSWRPMDGDLALFPSSDLRKDVARARQHLQSSSNDEVDDLAQFVKAHESLMHDLDSRNYWLYPDTASAFVAALFDNDAAILKRLKRSASDYLAALILAVAARLVRYDRDANHKDIGIAIRYFIDAADGTGLFAPMADKTLASSNAALASTTVSDDLHGRAETTYLNIIGGLLDMMLRRTPAGKPQSVFDSQAAISAALLAHHAGKPGISQRTLDEKFSQAKKSIST